MKRKSDPLHPFVGVRLSPLIKLLANEAAGFELRSFANYIQSLLIKWLGPRELVHRGWDDFPIDKENHHEKDEKDSGANHPDTA